MDIFRISELETLTGLARSTIYHYQRIGLLPPARRIGGSPASYGSGHLQALDTIRRLRREGLSVAEIRTRLGTNAAEQPDLRVLTQGLDALSEVIERGSQEL